MSSISFARAFGREKPHSSITDWVDILTGPNYAKEAHDGIPELVESINLQPTGPSEASRAIRKKLKHGDAHHQYRAIVILNALVGNCGPKFQTTFADDQLVDAIRHIALENSSTTEVKRKMLSVLLAWHAQFKGDPKMSVVSGLYSQVKPISKRDLNWEVDDLLRQSGLGTGTSNSQEKEKKKKKAEEKKRKEEEKRKEQEKQKEQEAQRRSRILFDFEKEKPKILNAIVSATQACNNLVNGITLVNTETDSVVTNERVQDCLLKAKASRRTVVRYIQLVEDEEIIGTLIETNERIMSAIATYEELSNPTKETAEPRDQLSKEQRTVTGEERQETEGTVWDGPSGVHPDLRDINFGLLGSDAQNLPPPLRPISTRVETDEEDTWQRGGSLSDFSDYQSSDEETHARVDGEGSRSRRAYVTVSDDDDDVAPSEPVLKEPADDDPFADPFEKLSVSQTRGQH